DLVLDADVGLDHADHGIEDQGPGDDDVELRRGRSSLRHPRPEVSGIAPERFVAGGLTVIGHAEPEVGVAEPDPVSSRRTVPLAPLVGAQGPQRPPAPSSPPYLTRSTSTEAPGAQRTDEPAGRSRRKPAAAA